MFLLRSCWSTGSSPSVPHVQHAESFFSTVLKHMPTDGQFLKVGSLMCSWALKVVAAMCLLAASAVSDAAVIYSIDFDQVTYNVNAGSTFDVKLIFRETVTGLDVAKLAAGGADGLFSAGVKLDYGVSGATINSMTLNDGAGFFDDSGSNISNFNNGLRTAEVLGASLNGTDGIEVAEVPALSGIYSIELATISFTASMINGETTTLLLSDLDSLFDDTVLADVTVLDSIVSFGNATIVNSGTAAVPEPSAFFAVSLGAAVYWFRKRNNNA